MDATGSRRHMQAAPAAGSPLRATNWACSKVRRGWVHECKRQQRAAGQRGSKLRCGGGGSGGGGGRAAAARLQRRCGAARPRTVLSTMARMSGGGRMTPMAFVWVTSASGRAVLATPTGTIAPPFSMVLLARRRAVWGLLALRASLGSTGGGAGDGARSDAADLHSSGAGEAWAQPHAARSRHASRQEALNPPSGVLAALLILFPRPSNRSRRIPCFPRATHFALSAHSSLQPSCCLSSGYKSHSQSIKQGRLPAELPGRQWRQAAGAAHCHDWRLGSRGRC